MEDNKSYYVYIILCETDSYYTGITNDLINRFNKHAKGRGG
ncbi:GIY-YIG nuclease family protein [Brachyspira hyodysenteriae]|nr:GIY-YIG nuclease family protein [Brachyspira hyodysenteriae]MDA0030469.1 GIY-YIG nuclease family protein [Brachyspira hyodysenteriae]